MKHPSETDCFGMRIPPHMWEPLLAYVTEGRPTGDFLSAILTNDLKEAVARADDENIRNIPAFVAWLYQQAPAACWGSRDRVAAWRNQAAVAAEPVSE